MRLVLILKTSIESLVISEIYRVIKHGILRVYDSIISFCFFKLSSLIDSSDFEISFCKVAMILLIWSSADLRQLSAFRSLLCSTQSVIKLS